MKAAATATATATATAAAQEKHVHVSADTATDAHRPKALSMLYNKGQLKSYNDFVTWVEESLENACGDDAPEIDLKPIVKMKSRPERKALLESQLKDVMKKVGKDFPDKVLDRCEQLEKEGLDAVFFSRRTLTR